VSLTLIELRDQLTTLLDRGAAPGLPVAVDLTCDEGDAVRLGGLVSLAVEQRCAEPTLYLIADENEAIEPLGDAALEAP